jgi:hypothetical protein
MLLKQNRKKSTPAGVWRGDLTVVFAFVSLPIDLLLGLFDLFVSFFTTQKQS